MSGSTARHCAGNFRRVTESADFAAWIGREHTVSERIAAEPAKRLAAILDRTDASFAEGAPLPPLCHWLHFNDAVPQSQLGIDGHPQKGGFLPPVALPRRMWAGGSLRFHAALRVGDEVRRNTRIDGITPRRGRSGDLVFVTLQHKLFRNAELLVEEQQDIVYREAGSPAGEGRAAPGKGDWSREIVPDNALLFRYSALTFNAHRIHYDRDYAVGEEGYPDLVVQGPLTATLLLEALSLEEPGAAVAGFEFRGVAPLYAGTPLTLQGRREGSSVSLWALNAAGNVAMEATATLS
ncbi:MAG: acyl-CoA dehydrogenase [Halioglobus sp.]|nr:acyl-CoA dehydrogenase [Halioglobus sp.]